MTPQAKQMHAWRQWATQAKDGEQVPPSLQDFLRENTTKNITGKHVLSKENIYRRLGL